LAAPVDVQSTPTFLINGRKFEGAIPMYKMKIILDELTK
jgi:protein-disulfide isomerase